MADRQLSTDESLNGNESPSLVGPTKSSTEESLNGNESPSPVSPTKSHASTEVPLNGNEKEALPHVNQGLTNQFLSILRKKVSVARCKIERKNNPASRSQSPYEIKKLKLEIPCPKCKQGDCFWHCYNCLKPLLCDKENMLDCDCGKELAPVSAFKFRCTKCFDESKEYEEYEEYDEGKLKEALGKLHLAIKEINILVLGQTGVGKSTWINAIANYLTHESLDSALKGELIHLIPVLISEYDKNNEPRNFWVGDEPQKKYDIGESVTQAPTIYSFRHKGFRLNFIDTPGIGDTGGKNMDTKHVMEIINTIGNAKHLHGICILMKAEENRYTKAFKYCINELVANLHRNAIQNLIFCFTYTRVKRYNPGDGKQIMERHFSRENIDFTFDRNNHFCMDNEPFNYLCAKSKNIEMDKSFHTECAKSWEKSRHETYRLIECVSGLDAHLSSETKNLFEIKKLISTLPECLAIITKQIQENESEIRRVQIAVMNLGKNEKNLREKLKFKRYFFTPKDLGFKQAVCILCTTKQLTTDKKGARDVNEVCCKKCSAISLYFCGAFGHLGWAGKKCSSCEHSMKDHKWSSTFWEEKSEDVVDEHIVKLLETATNHKEIKEKVIKNYKKKIIDYENVQKRIYEISVRLSQFIQDESIIFQNGSIEDNFKLAIKKARDDGKLELQAELEEALKSYSSIESNIVEQLGSATEDNTIPQLTLDGAIKLREELFSLDPFGKDIKSMIDGIVTNAEKNNAKVIFDPFEKREDAKYNMFEKISDSFNSTFITGIFARSFQRSSK